MHFSSKLKFSLAILACLPLGMAIQPAFATSTATTTFTVSATIQATCLVSATSLSFGTYTGAVATSSSTVSVTCTNTTPYHVGLNAGLASGATVTTRQMAGPGGALLNYGLYSDSGHSTNWGNTVGTDAIAGTGNGSAQAITVYGQIPAGQYLAPGSYQDTITATVTYSGRNDTGSAPRLRARGLPRGPPLSSRARRVLQQAFMILFQRCRNRAAVEVLAAAIGFFLSGAAAGAQALAVLPVNILLAPGQGAASLTVTNHGTAETAIQIRPFLWDQVGGEDHLNATDVVVVSPPIATIAPGATQVVRLILRKPPQGQEADYRILIDQIPPPAEPGIVHVVLRLSIPIFAQPTTRAVPHVQFHIECDDGQVYLVGVNDGLRHEAIRDIELSTKDGAKAKADSGISPYILPGVTRRWHVAVPGPLPQPGETLRFTAHADAGTIDEQLSVAGKP